MDELFQKAAENYPLKTGKGNFDGLMPFIAGETATNAAPAKATGKRKTALLLLAFLIIGGGITTYLVRTSGNDKTVASKTQTKETLNSVSQNKTNTQLNGAGVVSDNTIGSAEDFIATDETIYQKNKTGSYTKSKLSAKIMQGNAVEDGVVTESVWDDYTTKTGNKTAADITNISQTGNADLKDVTKKEATVLPEEKKEIPAEQKTSAGKKNKNRPFIYYGIAAGAELNQVKNQGMTKPGFNGGIVLGLQLNKKLSVETGVQLSQKKYYTAGKHFEPKAGSMPANMTINSLDGTSTLIEIPVSIKYNLSKKKNTLYGKAGVSSFIMTKEANKYQALVSGQDKEINSTYKNTKTYTAAELRLSAGYQHSLGKKLNIRVEPYIQIPLRGIGIGALPVTSTGLQLVLTRN